MKFNKQILREGFYSVSNGKGGRRPEFISKSRLQHWANQHAEMKAAGLLIPAPDFHDIAMKPVDAPEKVGSKGNYGFWDSITAGDTVDENGSPIFAMDGVVDVPVESDANRIGKSVREVSIYAEPEFVDGKGKLWKDVLTHVALVTRPIEPGQKNFEPVNALATSMSHALPIQMTPELSDALEQNGQTGDDLYSMLESVAGIVIPKETTPEQLTNALRAALLQKQKSESGNSDGSLTKPPGNSTLNEVPIIMAQTPKTPPVETPPATPVVDPTVMALQSENAGLKNVFTNQKRQELANRLARLKQRGLVDEAEVTAYTAEIGAVQMSFDDNQQPIPSGVERVLAALEKVKIPTGPKPVIAMADQQGDNYIVQPFEMPTSQHTQVTDERADEIVNGMMGTTSV